jgi:hypothetical protein
MSDHFLARIYGCNGHGTNLPSAEWYAGHSLSVGPLDRRRSQQSEEREWRIVGSE